MDKINQPIRILFAEDLPADAEIARREILKEGIEFTHRVVDTEAEFRKELESFAPDIVVSDYSMPTFDGMEALRITKSFSRHIPFIILTGSMNEETAVACMKAGANDYVIKEQIKRLPFAVKEAIEKNKSRLEKERIEIQLRENEAMYRSLIENSSDAIYLLFNRRFEIINSKFTRMFGYDFEEVNRPGFDFIQIVAPESRTVIEERIEKVKRGEKVSNRYEFTAIAKNGSRKEIEASVSYIDFKGAIATQGILRDISERKKMIEDLMEAKERAEESDRLKSAFLANMSHEIRTPMNGILGFTDLLKEPKLTGDEKNQYVAIMQKSGKRMLSTINDLMDISKIESGTMEIHLSVVNINKKMDYFYNFFKPEAEAKGFAFTVNKALDNHEVNIETDKEKLNAALSNLIKNAIKYTDEGSIEFGYKADDGNIQFYVKDTGIGIKKERQKAVFERFIQADTSLSKPYEGAGLGLSIAKGYIEKLGGKIWVESEKDKGSTFYFTIPFNEKPDKTVEEKASETSSPIDEILGQLTILIAEDEEVGRMYLTELIGNKCKEILFAENGKDAVELYKKHPETDLVLMDIKMPVMDGYSASMKIKEMDSDALIIAQTAYALAGDREKALAAGCRDYLTKPLKKLHIEEVIQKYFG